MCQCVPMHRLPPDPQEGQVQRLDRSCCLPWQLLRLHIPGSGAQGTVQRILTGPWGRRHSDGLCCLCSAVAQTWNTSLFSHTGLPNPLSCPPQGYCSMFSVSSGNLHKYCFDDGGVAQRFVWGYNRKFSFWHPQSHINGRIKCKTVSFHLSI